MEIPLQISAHDFALSADTEADIQERAAKLESYYDHIIRCRVVIEAPVKHHRQGGPFNVRIDVTVPGNELVVNRQNNEELAVALRDAFDAMRRRLEDYARHQRGAVKAHEEPLQQGHITKLFAHEGYGFLETAEGREVYFHRNSVIDADFAHLTIGDEVRFAEAQGEKGPQASTVHISKSSRNHK